MINYKKTFFKEYFFSKVRFAHCSLKKPIVKCIVGLGDEWRNDEISFLAGNYPEVNFQHEDPSKYKYNKVLNN